jgi:hypothetical protein
MLLLHRAKVFLVAMYFRKTGDMAIALRRRRHSRMLRFSLGMRRTFQRIGDLPIAKGRQLSPI